MTQPPTVLVAMLSFLRAQVEAQLRHIADAELHCAMSEHGVEAAAVGPIVACIDQIALETEAIRDTSLDLRAEVRRLSMLT